MYAEFYGLSGRPFQLTPDPRFYFDTRTHRKAMAYLSYGLNQGEGFIIITGDIGAGKTTLVGHLFESLDKSQYVFAKVVTTQLDADNTLRMVAGAFGINIEGLDKASMIQRMERFLRTQYDAGRRVLLIVDEVQNLPISALEELRMLSNYQEGDHALLQIFLLGQPEFKDKLASSMELEQLRQRVIATHHLEPMGPEEVSGYIQHRLSLVGWNQDPVFTEGAYRLIHGFTGGVPRRLNNLCSRLLLFGSLEELHEINERVVEEVINDLKKDNTPTTGPTYSIHGSGGSGTSAPAVASTPIRSNVPPKIRSDGDVASRSNGHGHAVADTSELEQRIAVLEGYVQAHDRTIREALELLGQWVDVQAEQDG